MQLKAILNSVEKHKGFVYDRIEWDKKAFQKTLLIHVRPDVRIDGYCSGCGVQGPHYDTLAVRRFQYVPLWAILVFFVYAMRRIDCATCGVTVEMVPWAEGKKRLTRTYAWFLANWAKRMCWTDVADAFKTSWSTVYRAVEAAVEWGLKHVDLSGITAIGVDEVHWKRKSGFLTLVYQIDGHRKRLLWIGQHRTMKTIKAFFTWFGKERAAELKFVCSDMWKPYLRVIKAQAGLAVHVLDRFHVMSHFSKAIDKVRAGEAKVMKSRGMNPVLKGSRWCWLKRPENLTETQGRTLKELLQLNLRTVKSYLLKEDFNNFWEYTYRGSAAKFLDTWCFRTMRSKIEPMKDVAKMLRNHRELLLNWFDAKGQVSVGAVEGMNNKAKTTTKKAYGFRTFKAIRIAYYHALGDLPQPAFTHRFW